MTCADCDSGSDEEGGNHARRTGHRASSPQSSTRLRRSSGRVGLAGHRRRARLPPRRQGPRVDGRRRGRRRRAALPLAGRHRVRRRHGHARPHSRRRARHHGGRAGAHFGQEHRCLDLDDPRPAEHRGRASRPQRVHVLRRRRRRRKPRARASVRARNPRRGHALSRGQPSTRIPEETRLGRQGHTRSRGRAALPIARRPSTSASSSSRSRAPFASRGTAPNVVRPRAATLPTSTRSSPCEPAS